MASRSLLLVLLGALLVAPARAGAETGAGSEAGAFSAGRVRAALGAGSGSIGAQSYIVALLAAGYFVYDGLEVGLAASHWFGDPPQITELGPEVRYIAFQVPTLHPFVGALYKHRFWTDGLSDQDILGGRAGLIGMLTPELYLQGGVLAERVVSECHLECSSIAPELALGLSF